MPDNELYEILDRALARYSDAEPLAGLEERVLARVRRAKRRAGAGQAWAIACAAAVLGVMILLHVSAAKTAPPIASLMALNQTFGSSEPGAQRPELPLPMQRARWSFDAHFQPVRKIVQRQLPKLQYFPSRTPMTAEEKALVRLVTESPNEAAKLFSDWERHAADPIKIEPIQIVPLETGDSNPNEPEVKRAGY